MHFTYDEEIPTVDDKPNLSQGDILERTPELDAILKEYHPYYERSDQNKYFIILTQTCDLVKGREHDPCKSKYISISPVRPLSLLINKKIEVLKDQKLDIGIPVCADKNKNSLSNFLRRLLNNNETEYFYLHEDKSLAFPESCCAFLRLSISIKAKENYETCLKSRILTLSDSFRDKLGWALGQIYSRVGTQDWSKEKLTELIKGNISNVAVWIPEKNLKKLQKNINEWHEKNVGQTLDKDTFDSMIGSLESKKESVIAIIDDKFTQSEKINNLITNGHLQQSDIEKIIAQINSNPVFTSLLK